MNDAPDVDPRVPDPAASGDAPGDPTPRGRGPVVAAIVVAAVVLGALVLLLATGGGGEDDGTSEQAVGRLAPQLVGVSTTGETVDIDDLRGKWVLVNFFATWCPPCVAEHPELVAFSERNEGDAEVISVAFDEPAPVIEEFFTENGGDWPVVAEDTGRIVLDYGVVKLPESYLIAPDGTVVKKLAGGVTAAELEGLMAENPTG